MRYTFSQSASEKVSFRYMSADTREDKAKRLVARITADFFILITDDYFFKFFEESKLL